MASAALLAAGCSTENKAEGTEYGTLKVSCTADGSIVAASDDTSRMPAAPSVPQAGDFTLTVTGESGTQQWDTLTEFEQSDAVFRMGTYAVSVAHGDPDAEGIDKPYYAAEKSVEVLPRRAATVEKEYAFEPVRRHGALYAARADLLCMKNEAMRSALSHFFFCSSILAPAQSRKTPNGLRNTVMSTEVAAHAAASAASVPSGIAARITSRSR